MTDRRTDHWRGRHYDADHIAGPIHFLNPTTRLLPIHKPKPSAAAAANNNTTTVPNGQDNNGHEKGQPPDTTTTSSSSAEQLQKTRSHTGIYTVWRSRDNRKGRHALALTTSAAAEDTLKTDGVVPTNTWPAALAGIKRMVTRYPVWDVSYDVAVIFTLGSLVWVLNGFFVLIPITNPNSSWPGESSWGGGVSACVGATIFEIGSILLMLEAVNENRSECFGWALEEVLEESRENLLQLRKEKSGCRHHHVEKTAWLSRKGKGTTTNNTTTNNNATDYNSDRDNMDVEDDGKNNSSSKSNSNSNSNSNNNEKTSSVQDKSSGTRRWTWWPSWYELRTHYFRDIGFLACLSQMVGATVFWISGFTGLPQILGVLTLPATNGIYWLPQVIGGSGFIISSWLFMLETQSKWYIPAPQQLGWHVGFWNLVGALGFTLCGALGFASSNTAYEVALTWATFIGSWSFLIGSVAQWYESLDKYPCVVAKNISHLGSTGNRTEDAGPKV